LKAGSCRTVPKLVGTIDGNMATLRGARTTPQCFSRAIFRHSRPGCAIKGQKRFLCLSKQANSQLAFVSSEYNEVYKRSIEDPGKFWGELASTRLQWIKPFTEVMDCDMNVGKHRWFMDGLLNVSGLV
jgi:acetyl-CoA synthetase